MACRLANIPMSLQTLVPGNKTVLGVTCDIYPLHGSAMGTICGDMNDDILVRLEVHSDADRIHQGLTRQLTSIDLTTPVEPSKIAIPSGLTTLVPSTSQH